MKPLLIEPEAEAELRAAIKWYERERVGLGDELWSDVQQALRMISENPSIGAAVQRIRVPGGARRLPVRRFPYFVIYRERLEHIQIVAVAHQSRRPGYWRVRDG